MTFYGETNIGRIRKNNEDAFIARTIWNDTHLLCAAIDGIGGNYGGDVAAEVTRDTIISHLEDFPVAGKMFEGHCHTRYTGSC